MGCLFTKVIKSTALLVTISMFGAFVVVAQDEVGDRSSEDEIANESEISEEEEVPAWLSDDLDSEYSENYLSNSPSAIQERMMEEVENQCNDNGCTIVAMEQEDKGWTVSLNVGTGNNSSSGNTFIIGGATQDQHDDEYVGVNVTYKNLKCNSKLKLQKEWYLTLTSHGAYARDENNKPVRITKSDTKFFALIVTELAKQLNQAGCNR